MFSSLGAFPPWPLCTCLRTDISLPWYYAVSMVLAYNNLGWFSPFFSSCFRGALRTEPLLPLLHLLMARAFRKLRARLQTLLLRCTHVPGQLPWAKGKLGLIFPGGLGSREALAYPCGVWIDSTGVTVRQPGKRCPRPTSSPGSCRQRELVWEGRLGAGGWHRIACWWERTPGAVVTFLLSSIFNFLVNVFSEGRRKSA